MLEKAVASALSKNQWKEADLAKEELSKYHRNSHLEILGQILIDRNWSAKVMDVVVEYTPHLLKQILPEKDFAFFIHHGDYQDPEHLIYAWSTTTEKLSANYIVSPIKVIRGIAVDEIDTLSVNRKAVHFHHHGGTHYNLICLRGPGITEATVKKALTALVTPNLSVNSYGIDSDGRLMIPKFFTSLYGDEFCQRYGQGTYTRTARSVMKNIQQQFKLLFEQYYRPGIEFTNPGEFFL